MFTANSVHEDPVLGFFVYLAGGRLTGSVHFHTHNTFFQPNLKILFNKTTDTDTTVNSQSAMSHQWLKNWDLNKHSC